MNSRPLDDLAELADAYVHRLLRPDEAARFEERCRIAPEARAALAEAQARQRALWEVGPVSASEALISATLDRIPLPRPSLAARYGKYFWAACATAALVLLSAHLYVARMTPSPSELLVFGQHEWLAGSWASLRVHVRDRVNGTPLPGVPVSIELRGPGQPIQLARFATDALGTGSPRFRVPEWASGAYQLHVATDSASDGIARSIKLTRSWRVLLSSDKPLYQPGQTVRARSLTLSRSDGRPLAGQKAEFTLEDPEGNIVFQQTEVTSEFGIAAVDCPLASEILEGRYRLACVVGDTRSEQSLDVRTYVLPKFRVDAALDQPFYQPGDRVDVEIKAAYFFGKPVAGGHVSWEPTYVDPSLPSSTRGDGQLDASGAASFDFRLPESLANDLTFGLRVTVRDSAGQQQTALVNVVASAQPVRIEVVPESGVLVPAVPNRLYVLTSYPDGRPARARVKVSALPHELQTNELGVAMFVVTPPQGRDSLVRDFSAVDDQGRTGRRHVELECGRSLDDFLVRTDRAVYDGGDSVDIAVLGGGNRPIYLDIVQNGQTILTRTLPMTRGRGQLTLDLPAHVDGTVEIAAHRITAAGETLRRNRVVYVTRASELRVQVAADRDEYRPGEKARLDFQVTDRQGQPRPGALSLSAVDEAVFAVAGSAPWEAAAPVPHDRLAPALAAHAWSPAMRGPANPARDEYELALFSLAGRRSPDHAARLRKLVDEQLDGATYVLDVLQRPDWEELAEQAGLTPEMVQFLKGDDPAHSLSASSYPAKEQQLQIAQRRAHDTLKSAWFALAVVAGLGLLIALSRQLGGFAPIVLLLALGGILITLLLPAVHSAREAGRRSMAWNSLKTLGLALDQAQQQSPDETAGGEAPSPSRVREWFPETLLWRPELITDDQGRASLEIELADSITDWRLSASAVTSTGQLGAAEQPLRVFQPFFVDLDLPASLTRGDELTLPAVVYNYTDQPLQVTLTLQASGALQVDEAARKIVELQPREVRSVGFRVRATQIGAADVDIAAQASGVEDAVRRRVDVLPDGQPVERTSSGSLQQPVDVDITVPDEALEGTVRTTLSIYPSTFSHVIEGLEALFRRPYGCFEQTSATTYPNVLALQYLNRTGQSNPAVESRARDYIHLGYQRLVSFEVRGGGFDWFGRPPANLPLTAFGLREFREMSRVHPVDPRLIERTRAWLLAQRSTDGSWDDDLATTAYTAWAVFGDMPTDYKSEGTLLFLQGRAPESIESAYELALVCNALLALDASGAAAAPYLERLLELREATPDSRLVWWPLTSRRHTLFYGHGTSGDVEATALAALALLRSRSQPGTARAALEWLIEAKDASGAWSSTQATVLALEALLAGAGRPLGGAEERHVDITVDGRAVTSVHIPADQPDVVRSVEVPGLASPGRHQVRLIDRSGGGVAYQLVTRFHVPELEQVPASRLSLGTQLDDTHVAVGERLQATTSITNTSSEPAPMVVAEVPLPAGFAVDTARLEEAREADEIDKFQVAPDRLTVYLRELPAGQTKNLAYTLVATTPAKVTMAAPTAYLYYEPEQRARGTARELTATAPESDE